jgi:hypothetical protein
MQKILLTLLALLLPLCAAAQTAKTRDDLYTEIDAQLPSSGQKQITAAILRSVIKSTVASSRNELSDGPPTHLPAYANEATISVETAGMGWDELGRFTLQTPVGAFQVYSVGSPAVPTLYWPGTIVSNKSESLATTTTLPASNITAGLGNEGIPLPVMRNSFMPPFDRLQAGSAYAGTNGIPYVMDTDYLGNETEPTVGVYWAQVNVVAGGTSAYNEMRGRYRTQAQALTDLGRLTATASLDFPSIAAGAQADLTISLSGVVVGDSISLGPPAAPAAGLMFYAFVSAANTVTVRAANISAAPVDAAAATFRVTKF